MFTILSLRLNPLNVAQSKVTFDKLSSSVLSSAQKKDKICTIGEKIYILITKSDDQIIDEFISKVHQSLNGGGATNVIYLMLKVNPEMNSADDVFNEFDLEAARAKLNQR
jgi:hypothetical protein